MRFCAEGALRTGKLCYDAGSGPLCRPPGPGRCAVKTEHSASRPDGFSPADVPRGEGYGSGNLPAVLRCAGVPRSHRTGARVPRNSGCSSGPPDGWAASGDGGDVWFRTAGPVRVPLPFRLSRRLCGESRLKEKGRGALCRTGPESPDPEWTPGTAAQRAVPDPTVFDLQNGLPG